MMLTYTSTWMSTPTCNIEFQEINLNSLLDIYFYGVRDSCPWINLELSTSTDAFLYKIVILRTRIHSFAPAHRDRVNSIEFIVVLPGVSCVGIMNNISALHQGLQILHPLFPCCFAQGHIA